MATTQIDRRNPAARPTAGLVCGRLQSDSTRRIPFLLVYQSARHALFSQALFMTKSHQAAEEVVQDVFTYAWLNSESYNSRQSGLSTWLALICRSRAIDYLRSQKACPTSRSSEYDMDVVVDPQPGPESRQTASALKQAISTALRSLPAAQRQLLVMHYYAELSHAEIAELIGIPLGTVKTNIRRARNILAANASLSSFQGSV